MTAGKPVQAWPDLFVAWGARHELLHGFDEGVSRMMRLIVPLVLPARWCRTRAFAVSLVP